MKIAALSVSLLISALAPAQAQDGPGEGRLAGCFFAKTFGSGTNLAVSGVETFKVVAGAEVRCFTGCYSGGEFTTSYNLGGATSATGVGDSDGATEENDHCESTSKFIADADYTELGWSLTTSADYKAMSLTCFW